MSISARAVVAAARDLVEQLQLSKSEAADTLAGLEQSATVTLDDVAAVGEQLADALAERGQSVSALAILHALFDKAEGHPQPFEITRAGQGSEIAVDGVPSEALDYTDLTGDFRGERMLCASLVGKPDARRHAPGNRLHVHAGEELLYLVKGGAQFAFYDPNRETIIRDRMAPAGAVWLDSSEPHMFEFDSSDTKAIAAYVDPAGFPRQGKKRLRRASLFSSKMRVGRLAKLLVGERLRAAREIAGLTLDEVKVKAQVDFAAPYLHRLEKGQLSPSLNDLSKVVDFFGLDWADIFRSDRVVGPFNSRIESAEQEHNSDYPRIRSEHHLAYEKYKGVIKARPIISGSDSQLSLFEFIVTKKAEFKNLHLAAHPAQEGIYVLEGSLTFYWWPRPVRLRHGLSSYMPTFEEFGLNGLEKLRSELQPLQNELPDSEILRSALGGPVDEPVEKFLKREVRTLNPGDFLFLDSSRVFHFFLGKPGTQALVFQWRPSTRGAVGRPTILRQAAGKEE